MRLLALILVFLAPAVLAAEFQGRQVEILDARTSSQPAPLILNLHGAGGTGPGHRRYSRFDAIAAPYGVVVAYPSAPGPRWNDGRWDILGDPEKAARDDVGWFRALVAALVEQGLADPSRVYAIGHSNGGAMVRRLTCDAGDMLAGAAIVGTTLLTEFECRDDTPIATAFFMGTADQVIPFEGRPTGWESVIPMNIGKAHSAPASAAILAARNGCSGEAATTVNPDASDGMSVIRHEFTGCAAPVVFYEITGGGHVWPGAPAIPPGRMRALLGGPVLDIDAGAEAMKLWLGAPD